MSLVERAPPSTLQDSHIHTARCGHAVGSMEEYVAYARRQGLTEIGFSDHLYVYWLPVQERDPEVAMREDELDEYVEEVQQLQYANPDLTIRLAIEADYIEGREAELKTILKRYPWDYVLGSVHFIDEWGFDDDRYLAGYETWNIDELYQRYFDLVMRAAETGLFDSMSHADLIKTFGYRPTPGFDLAELFNRTAACFKRAEVCVEVNTAGLLKPCAEIFPALGLLRACQRAGVPASLGSDAHRPEHVGLAFDRAVSHLRAGGYDRVIGFEARKRSERWLP